MTKSTDRGTLGKSDCYCEVVVFLCYNIHFHILRNVLRNSDPFSVTRVLSIFRRSYMFDAYI